MAFGDSPEDAALQEAWTAFCERLRDAGGKAFKDYNPATPAHRADAFRFLTQNLGQAFDLALETKDTCYPALHAFCNPTRKLGGDAADLVYLQAWIDGRSTYRIAGDRGTARFLHFTVQGPRPDRQPGTDWPTLHEPFGDTPEANLSGLQLQADPDGRFELYIGGPQRGPNWLPTTPHSRKLFIRQGFDRWDERPARMRIERIDMAEPRPLPMPADMIAAMGWAGDFITGVMRDWPDHPFQYTGAHYLDWVNRFPPEPADSAAADKRRGRAVANMTWVLAPDEALIVEFDDPGGFWMMSMMGAFFNSLDYLYRPVSYTPSRTWVGADGKVRLVLAHDDPGCANWLDTQGFERGNLTYRLLMSEARTEFVTRLIKKRDLMDALPADTPRVSSNERVSQLHERFDAIRWRYSL